jgi:hypothetical protein
MFAPTLQVGVVRFLCQTLALRPSFRVSLQPHPYPTSQVQESPSSPPDPPPPIPDSLSPRIPNIPPDNYPARPPPPSYTRQLKYPAGPTHLYATPHPKVSCQTPLPHLHPTAPFQESPSIAPPPPPIADSSSPSIPKYPAPLWGVAGV